MQRDVHYGYTNTYASKNCVWLPKKRKFLLSIMLPEIERLLRSVLSILKQTSVFLLQHLSTSDTASVLIWSLLGLKCWSNNQLLFHGSYFLQTRPATMQTFQRHLNKSQGPQEREKAWPWMHHLRSRDSPPQNEWCSEWMLNRFFTYLISPSWLNGSVHFTGSQQKLVILTNLWSVWPRPI